MKIHFCLTDGRPWYKQVVSGIIIFIALIFLLPFAYLFIAIPCAAIVELGLLSAVLGLLKLIAMIFIVFAVFVIALIAFGWSHEN